MAINQFYFWKGLYIDIAHFVRECEQCSETAELQQCQQLEEAEGGNGSGENKNTGSRNASKVWQKVRYCQAFCILRHWFLYSADIVEKMYHKRK